MNNDGKDEKKDAENDNNSDKEQERIIDELRNKFKKWKKKKGNLEYKLPITEILTFDYPTEEEYKEGILHNFIPQKSYTNMLDKLNRILTKSYLEKKRYDKVEIPNWIYFIALGAVVIFGIYLIIIYRAPRQSNGKNLKFASMVFGALGILILIFMELYILFKEVKPGKTLEEFYLPRFKEVLDEANRTNNRNVCMKFVLDDKYLLIQIKNYNNLNINNIDIIEEDKSEKNDDDEDEKKSDKNDDDNNDGDNMKKNILNNFLGNDNLKNKRNIKNEISNNSSRTNKSKNSKSSQSSNASKKSKNKYNYDSGNVNNSNNDKNQVKEKAETEHSLLP